MSAVSREALESLQQLTHEEIEEMKIRLVQVPRVAFFTILATGLGQPKLAPFHGLVDLPTMIRASVSEFSSDKSEDPSVLKP